MGRDNEKKKQKERERVKERVSMLGWKKKSYGDCFLKYKIQLTPLGESASTCDPENEGEKKRKKGNSSLIIVSLD